MRTVDTQQIQERVKELLLESSYNIGEKTFQTLKQNYESETNVVSKSVLDQIIKNDEIALNENIPMCQDTGMAVIFLEIGQEVHFIGENLYDSINNGVREAYNTGYLRKSVVDDPLFDRINTKDNTPSIIHTDIVPGNKVKITVAPKGFGSENMSAIKMLKPSDGVKGLKDFIIQTVKNAGPNPCPPIVLGIGIGGTFEKCAYMAKKALTREIGQHNKSEKYSNLEKELLEEINKLDIGPAGLGGKTTALAVHIEYFPTHIAGLPVAVNLCCHAYRHNFDII
nr:fumarate hydratase [Sedimentibacter sp.]